MSFDRQDAQKNPEVSIPLELLYCAYTSMEWMICALRFQRELSGMSTEDSPEMKIAVETLMILKELLDGRLT